LIIIPLEFYELILKTEAECPSEMPFISLQNHSLRKIVVLQTKRVAKVVSYVRNKFHVLKRSDLLFVANKPEVQYGRETGSKFPAFLTVDGGEMSIEILSCDVLVVLGTIRWCR
jgi:hypothetical protein